MGLGDGPQTVLVSQEIANVDSIMPLFDMRVCLSPRDVPLSWTSVEAMERTRHTLEDEIGLGHLTIFWSDNDDPGPLIEVFRSAHGIRLDAGACSRLSAVMINKLRSVLSCPASSANGRQKSRVVAGRAGSATRD